MLKNADCTIYEKDTYTRHVIHDVYWNDSRGAAVTKNGVQVQDSVLVYIYYSDYVPKNGDMVVRGAVNFEFDAAMQQTASASMAAFRASYPQFAVVRNVNDCRYGGLPHIEVTAR
ncbi:MAG: hypothetical protein IJM44_01490 [Ruminococcus sp.]|nr:hypothetical protein [Ruminococcus sp.]